MNDLELNNGKKATFLYDDFWSNAVYEIISPFGNPIKVVMVDGSLHTVTSDYEEPIASVKHEYQPKCMV